LAQSPSAPDKAVRCRQCARIARVNAELASNGEPLQKSFCPLDLTTPSESIRVAGILLSPEPVQEKVVRFARWIETNTLLPRLRNVQLNLDPIGVLENDKSNENFRTAMTLRDCTVFVRFPANAEDDHLIEARIGDLDIKSPDKAQYWKDMEKALIEGGWYTGTERHQDQQPLTCQLSPDRGNDPMARNFPSIRPHSH
jgi:inositol-pentakisphosphate 2-kinase